MTEYQCLSLLTDYGLEDGFVAACHGVLARLAPGLPVIDVTHLIPPGDIRRGAAVLAQTLPHLPAGVHIGVVDPGVGTARRPVVLRARGHLLVGPDNGLLVPAAATLGGADVAYEITNAAAMLAPVSATFHGRDVFAPAAARLAEGELEPPDVGPEIRLDSLVRLRDPATAVGEGYAEGEVVTIDRFGNVQTALTASQLSAAGIGAAHVLIECGDVRHQGQLGTTFASVPPGALVVYEDSAGLIAVAVHGGNAAATLAAHPGDAIRLTKPR